MKREHNSVSSIEIFKRPSIDDPSSGTVTSGNVASDLPNTANSRLKPTMEKQSARFGVNSNSYTTSVRPSTSLISCPIAVPSGKM